MNGKDVFCGSLTLTRSSLFGLIFLGLLCWQGLMTPAKADPRKLRIAIIAADNTSPYWVAAHAGAIKAQKQFLDDNLDVNLIWLAPDKPGDIGQITNLLENAIGSNVDGIAFAAVDSKAFTSTVEMAIRQKIPVLTLDGNIDCPLITSSVAISNYQSGAEAAVSAGRQLGLHAKILVIPHLMTDTVAEKRNNGFLDGTRNVNGSIEIIAPDDYAGATEDSAYQFSIKMLKRYGSEITGVFTPEPITTRAMEKALKDSNLSDKIQQYGFLVGDEAVSAIKSGSLKAVIIPDSFSMGYLGLRAVVFAVTGKYNVPPRVEVPEAVVSSENLSDPNYQSLLYPPINTYLPAK